MPFLESDYFEAFGAVKLIKQIVADLNCGYVKGFFMYPAVLEFFINPELTNVSAMLCYACSSTIDITWRTETTRFGTISCHEIMMIVAIRIFLGEYCTLDTYVNAA